ncbi:glycosyltransferase [Cellulomonas sp. HZM]|uniref:glycosyltransferase n=1 Tax=Cellulomonas sp. HZM TaxID=1454010 RepID=UPI0006917EB0|nr:glycosyltransferase [Cellulomonas sp. HZM]
MHAPPLLVDGPAIDETYDIAYLTSYLGKLDTGIAFTDRAYLAGLARSPWSTLVLGNAMAATYPGDGLAYTSQVNEYRRRDPRLHLVNGLGSFVSHLRGSYLPEHRGSHRVAVMHDEPAAFDFYAHDVWNRRHVRDVLMAAQDGFVFVSRRSRDLWVEYAGLEDSSLFVLPNTCAEEEWVTATLLGRERGDLRAAAGLPEHGTDLVVVGTLQRRKGQAEVVEAVRRVRASRPDLEVRLHLVGRPREREYGEELAAAIELAGLGDVVTLVGELPKHRALEMLAACDAMVLASHTEAMPLVVLEAMLVGTPILTTRAGGVPEMVDDASAAFFDAGDVDALAALVERVADEPGWARSLGDTAACRYQQDLSQARFRPRFDEVLATLARDAGLGTGPTVGPTTGPKAMHHGLGPERAVVERGADASHVVVRAVPRGARSWRAEVARLSSAGPVTRVELETGADLVETFEAAAPWVRVGLGVAEVSAPPVRVVLAADVVPALASRDLLRVVGAPAHEASYALHVRAAARRAAARARAQAATAVPVVSPTGGSSRAVDHDEQAGVRASPRTRGRGIARRARRSLARRARALRGRRAPVLVTPATTESTIEATIEAPQPVVDEVVSGAVVAMVFNSPMQLMAVLSLWDANGQRDGQPHRQEHVLADGSADARLVALVHSTTGADGFAARLVEMCRGTGRFATVADISVAYAQVYADKPSAASVRGFAAALSDACGGVPDEVYVAAYMSARAQKYLYEAFPGVPLHLFEDGVGSYVPKSIRLRDDGLVDRVTGRDCAQGAHVSALSTVDLMLRGVPVPAQYGAQVLADVPRIRFPQVRVGAYAIDYPRWARVLGAQHRAFAPDEVLLVTQNFSDHLRPRALVAEVERAVNDQVIEALLADGHRVVVRPHPRAGAQVWGERWADDPRFTVWEDQPMLPVEVLLDPGAPPALVVGATSSCLFYAHERMGLAVRRYPDAALDALAEHANDEHAWMMGLAAQVLPALDADDDAAVVTGAAR